MLIFYVGWNFKRDGNVLIDWKLISCNREYNFTELAMCLVENWMEDYLF